MAESRSPLDPHITVDWGGDDVKLRINTGQASIELNVREDLAERLIEDLHRNVGEIRRNRALKASGQVTP